MLSDVVALPLKDRDVSAQVENETGSMHMGFAIGDIPPVSGKTKDWSSHFEPPVSRPTDLELLTSSNDYSFHVQFDDYNATAAKDNWGNALVGIGEENKVPKEPPSAAGINQILHVEREQGSLLADEAIAAMEIRRSDVLSESTGDPALVQNLSATGPHVFHEQGYMMAHTKIDAIKNKSSDAIIDSVVDPKVVQNVSIRGKKKSPQKAPDSRSNFDRLRSNLKELLEFSDDQSAKVSLIMTVIRKNMDGALPSDLLPDLIHEAKLRLGNHSALFKASFKGVTSMVATCVQKGLVPDPYMAQESDAKRELIEAKHGEINTQVLGVPLVDSTMPRDEEDVTHVIAGLKPNQNAHLLGAHDSSKGRSDYNQILTDHGESPHPLNNLVQPDASSMDDLQIWDRPNYDPCKALVLYDANKGKNQIEDDPHAYANKEKATFKLATSYAFIDPKDAANGERRSESCKGGNVSVLNRSVSRLSARANIGVARANRVVPGEARTRRSLARAR
ncbi:hypothetical protein AAC387_Pa10g0663 [Persea americana]